MSTETETDRVRKLICGALPTYEAAAACCAALQSRPSLIVRPRKVPTADLKQIYAVRLVRSSRTDMPIGSEDVLKRLEGAAADVNMYVWEGDQRVFVVITDTSTSQLVACMVGRDRRAMEPTER